MYHCMRKAKMSVIVSLQTSSILSIYEGKAVEYVHIIFNCLSFLYLRNEILKV